jgi:predicted nucleic acid-binding Zn finger protein
VATKVAEAAEEAAKAAIAEVAAAHNANDANNVNNVNDEIIKMPSSCGKKMYDVNITKMICTCPDFIHRCSKSDAKCKHITAYLESTKNKV